jgi:hypothetical protein
MTLSQPRPSRRAFLETGAAGLTLGLADPAHATRQAPETLGAQPRLKVAALATTYYYLSHAYHIVGRFLDGFLVHEGDGFHEPSVDIASLFIEQIGENDLGVDKARRHGVRLSPTIEDALTLGTSTLAVDAVLLIAEHGDYPFNEKLQKLYPRARFFDEVVKVFKTSDRTVPVFIDKHLSYDRAQAARMVSTARELGIPLMAGSSLPVTWRLPTLEIPLGTPVEKAIVVSRGEIEIFGFHALETLQCMLERRDRKGHKQGVVAVRCVEGEDVWNTMGQGGWDWALLREALRRSHTLNPGDHKQNTRDFTPPPGRPTYLRHPIAFLVEYADGLRATALILNGQVDDTTFAAQLGDAERSLVSTLVYLPAPPGANFFTPLCLRIEDFFYRKKPPYPVERTLLTGGILDAALGSRIEGHRRVETPELARIDYEAPKDSGFIRTPIAEPKPNGLP